MSANAYKDFIKPFTGEGDVMSFITKVGLVAALKKVDDEAKFLPLYLEGHALAIYLEMDETDRKDPAKIKNRLKEAFCDGPFVAYAKLSSMKWGGEEVDVYANEIRRLAGLARFEGPSLEHIVKLTFINGLPDYMSVQLQQVGGILDSSLSEILARARVLTTHKATSAVAAVTTNWRPSQQEGRERASKTPPPGRERASKTPPPGSGGFRGKCFECGGPHMARHCTVKTLRAIRCYRCGREGHIAVYCGKGQGQGNEQGGTAAPAVILPQE